MEGDQRREYFQLMLAFLFGGIAIVSVFVFARTQTNPSAPTTQGTGKIVVWGTRPQEFMGGILQAMKEQLSELGSIQYRALDERVFYETYLEAVAVGQGPDLLLVDQKHIYLFADKLTTVPYLNFPEQNFKSSYVESAEVFLRPDGIVAIPFAIDPLVMFWNRDMFANAGLANPPQYWDEFIPLTERLNRVDANLNVTKSLVAFGEAHNVNNHLMILSLFMMQAGSRVTQWDSGSKKLQVAFHNKVTSSENQAVAALRFYTDFSNPSSRSYSWNRSLPEARAVFTAGDMALYFGRLSEFGLIARLNPNLNFDVALVPQVRGTQRRVTYATVEAFILPVSSRNPVGAYQLALRLSSPRAQAALSATGRLPPIRRDLLAQPQTTQYWSVAYDSAIIARTWIDPNPQQTDIIIRRMVESVKSGERTITTAVSQAEAEMASVMR